jgi:hypothetical protein
MELSDFIKNSLLSIYNGLQATNLAIAEKENKTLGKDIAATFCLPGKNITQKEGYVSFDVGVTICKESEDSTGGKLNVVIADVGAEASGSNKAELVNRIKFFILPNQFIGGKPGR